MEATVTSVALKHVIARAGAHKIMVHQTACDFVVSECVKGDLVEIHGIEDYGRGPRATRASWLSRPASTEQLPEFVGTVTAIEHGRRVCGFIRPDDGGADLFLHITAMADYDGVTSATFNRLGRGARLRGFARSTSRGPRAEQVTSV